MTTNLKVLFIKGQREILNQRNNDEVGERFIRDLEEAPPLRMPEMPLEENIDEELTKLSHRDDHPEWFKGYAPDGTDGVSQLCRTKESYFILKLWNRRDGYWKSFETKLTNYKKKIQNHSIEKQIETLVEEFKKAYHVFPDLESMFKLAK